MNEGIWIYFVAYNFPGFYSCKSFIHFFLNEWNSYCRHPKSRISGEDTGFFSWLHLILSITILGFFYNRSESEISRFWLRSCFSKDLRFIIVFCYSVIEVTIIDTNVQRSWSDIGYLLKYFPTVWTSFII